MAFSSHPPTHLQWRTAEHSPYEHCCLYVLTAGFAGIPITYEHNLLFPMNTTYWKMIW